ncbi:hypothetical protein EBX93_04995 [bacterium]|jgi:hypothetical protein|nr:hypothetical protein [bacterium]
MSDRKLLEEGEARVLYCTWKVTQSKVMTEERKAWINRTYGAGAADRIQAMMLEMYKTDLDRIGLSPSTDN